MSVKVTSSDICSAIKTKHSGDEWRVWFEVSEGTGSFSGRRADAVAMNIWPSRKYQIHCYEVKISRADFKNEMITLEKSEAVGKYCDFFWLVTPVGLVLPTEVPESWGLIELTKGGLRIKKQAPVRANPEPINRAFAASLLRAGRDLTEEAIQDRVNERSAAARIEIEKAITKRLETPLVNAESRNEKVENWITEFENIFGVKPNVHISPTEMAKRIRLAQYLDSSQLTYLARQAKDLAKMIEKIQSPEVKLPPGVG